MPGHPHKVKTAPSNFRMDCVGGTISPGAGPAHPAHIGREPARDA
jgi:hypothetical protein